MSRNCKKTRRDAIEINWTKSLEKTTTIKIFILYEYLMTKYSAILHVRIFRGLDIIFKILILKTNNSGYAVTGVTVFLL